MIAAIVAIVLLVGLFIYADGPEMFREVFLKPKSIPIDNRYSIEQFYREKRIQRNKMAIEWEVEFGLLGWERNSWTHLRKRWKGQHKSSECCVCFHVRQFPAETLAETFSEVVLPIPKWYIQDCLAIGRYYRNSLSTAHDRATLRVLERKGLVLTYNPRVW